MKRYGLLAVSLALMLAIAGLAGCTPATTVSGELRTINLGSQQEGIWVSGQGKVNVAPDIVTLSLGIEAQEASVAEAQTQAAGAMAQVMAALTGQGVAAKDIQTQRFSISRVTKWDNDKQQEVIIGYRVTNIVVAKIRDLDKAGSIIDAVAQAGGDLTRIDSIGFSVDDPSAYYEEARKKAMVDARAKAEQMAELADVTLGKPTYISESISYPIYPREYAVARAEAAPAPVETPISPGEMEVSVSVQVTYAIR